MLKIKLFLPPTAKVKAFTSAEKWVRVEFIFLSTVSHKLYSQTNENLIRTTMYISVYVKYNLYTLYQNMHHIC